MFYKTQLVDENGSAYGVKQVGNKPVVSNSPYTYEIDRGNVPGAKVLRVLGYNGDIDATNEDLWAVGGAYVFPTAPMQMEVISSSVNDDASPATGAQTVKIHYLNDQYEEKTEVVTMNGTTAVATTATNILRINHFHVQTAGSGGVAAGNIDIRHLDDTPIYSRILTARNAALTAVWTVPKNKTAFITAWKGGVGNASGDRLAIFTLRATSDAEYVRTPTAFQTKDIIVVQDGCTVVPCIMPLRIPELVDIKISVQSDSATANAFCGGHFEGWYE